MYVPCIPCIGQINIHIYIYIIRCSTIHPHRNIPNSALALTSWDQLPKKAATICLQLVGSPTQTSGFPWGKETWGIHFVWKQATTRVTGLWETTTSVIQRRSSREVRISWYPIFPVFSVVYFSRGTLPPKKNGTRALPGDSQRLPPQLHSYHRSRDKPLDPTILARP